MIIYDLGCEQAHRFEGWFASADDFRKQQAQDLLECPICASRAISRLPSAIHLGGQAAETPPQMSKSKPAQMQAPHPLALLKQMSDFVKAHTEDLGHGFAEEARRIHHQEAAPRPIRGKVSSNDYHALRDEGIDVTPFPAIERDDLN